MLDVRLSEEFSEWLFDLRDPIGRAKIRSRIARMRAGHLGDINHVGGGVSEARVMGKGPGYRLYFGHENDRLIVILCGGDKSSQSKDIAKAQQMWARRTL